MRSAAAVAHGANTSDNNRKAPSNDKCALAPRPAETASTAPAPKISTGIYKGRTSRDTSTPPPLSPKVSAAPIAPIRLNTGVPNNNDRASTSNASVCRSNWNPSIGDIRTSGTPVTIQCASALPSTSSINGWGESIICSNVPSR